MPSQHRPLWIMLEFSFSLKYQDANLIVVCNGRRVTIDVQAADLASSPPILERYLFLLQVADECELDEYTEDDVYDWIAEPLIPVFYELEALEKKNDTLETFFNPEKYFYSLRAEGDRLIPIQQPEPSARWPIFGIKSSEDYSSSISFFKPCQVQVCPKPVQIGPPSAIPSKVKLPDGTFAFLKVMRHNYAASMRLELKTYQQIQEAGLDPSLRISRLLGIVHSDGLILGLLLTYIDCRNRTLACAAKPGTAERAAARRKWAEQVRATVATLHEAGIVWGDVKPDNVLIDQDEDAWLIDFGGSYTEGWVPRELAGTIEGDRCGMKKMAGFLEQEASGFSQDEAESARAARCLPDHHSK